MIKLWKRLKTWWACRQLERYWYRYEQEPTYCDGCKRFSRGNICPYC